MLTNATAAEPSSDAAVLERVETRRLLVHPVLQREAATRPDDKASPINGTTGPSRFHTPFKGGEPTKGWTASTPL